MKKVPTACSDYLVHKNTPLIIVTNIFMRNGTLMFTGRVYNMYRDSFKFPTHT